MNFIQEYKKGQSGGNKGIPLGPGLAHLSSAINGLQKGRIYGIAAPPKAGKSTLADYGFVVQPYLHAIENKIPIEWIYFSWEMDRLSKEFDFASYFMYNDFGITHVKLENGQTKDGSDMIEMSSKYLRGRVQDDDEKIIKVKPKIEDALKQVYNDRIEPIFGEYADNGQLLKKGYVTLIEQKNNPTGLYKFFRWYAEQHGKFLTRSMGKGERTVGYVPKNPDKYVIFLSDHIRKLILERGWAMKQTIDKYLEYTVEYRNWCNYSFVHIVHLNRNLTDSARMRNSGDRLFPNSDDIKDTGNLSEDADFVFTMFNPTDDRYNLNKHFGEDIRDKHNNLIHPNLRTIHLVESRHCEFPQHFSVNMEGGIKNFRTFKNKK